MATQTRLTRRNARRVRVRKKVIGTAERPRLNVFRSNNHISVQVIDDEMGKTLVSASSLDADVKVDMKGKRGIEKATLLGSVIAERAKKAGISTVVFDRAGYQYHGQIKALADAAREGGLEF